MLRKNMDTIHLADQNPKNIITIDKGTGFNVVLSKEVSIRSSKCIF